MEAAATGFPQALALLREHGQDPEAKATQSPPKSGREAASRKYVTSIRSHVTVLLATQK